MKRSSPEDYDLLWWCLTLLALIIDLDLTLDAPGNPSSFTDRPIFNIDMGRVREQSIKGSCGNAVAVVTVLWSEVDPPFRLRRENGGSSEVEEEYFCRDSDFGFCIDDDGDDCGDVSDLGSSQYLASQPTTQV
ncbi:unnamed protein product [Cuscuta campestris]|uniref:Uncharacterized protein n=1 Tax=Cuscuta campestris TaxID=132261 RepID=A0A484K8T7_9ASTE|nr:unnamed protein product [Cuscuta campestris]